jgi:hypothetical protein
MNCSYLKFSLTGTLIGLLLSVVIAFGVISLADSVHESRWIQEHTNPQRRYILRFVSCSGSGYSILSLHEWVKNIDVEKFCKKIHTVKDSQDYIYSWNNSYYDLIKYTHKEYAP